MITIVFSLLDEHKGQPDVLNIDCTDPLNRSALITAIENENMDLIQLLLKAGIKVKDSLLHAIKEEYVEAVELLLEWEEKIHKAGEPYVSLRLSRDTEYSELICRLWIYGKYILFFFAIRVFRVFPTVNFDQSIMVFNFFFFLLGIFCNFTVLSSFWSVKCYS